MDKAPLPSGQPLDRVQPQQYCAYCGAQLVAEFYFCPNCATPYKGTESVLPRVLLARPTDGELIAKKAPHVWRIFWTYLAVIVGTAVFVILLFEYDRYDLWLLLQTAALFVTTCVFAVMHWPSLVVQFKRLGFLHPAAVAGILALGPLLAINYFYHGWLIEELGVERAVWVEQLRDLGLGTPTLVFFFCICPALLEEIAFRGLIQHWLHVAIPPLRAIVLASALFTVMHFTIISAPYIFLVGMVLGWTKWKTGSLYPSMAIHLAHNWLVLEFFRFE
jgi:membrane protease YdiL (CAAX protease family)